MFYLITIFIVLFLFLAWRRLDWAVMFLIAALPAYLIRFSIFGLPSTLLEIMIWVVFLAWFLKNNKLIFKNIKLRVTGYGLRNINRYPFDWEIVLLLLAAFAAAGVAGFSSASLGVFKAYFFEPALFFIVVFNVMRGEKGFEKILWALAASALAVSALAIYQKISGQLIDNQAWAAAETRRAVSFFGYPNAVGLFLGPLILVFTGWLFSVITNNQDAITKQYPNSKQKNKKFGNCNLEFVWNLFLRIWNLKTVFISLTIILSVLSIYFAKSKGALMGVAAGLLVFALLAGGKIRWAAVIVVMAAAVVVATYQPAGNLAVKNITLTNLSGRIRLAGWSDTWKMLKDGRLISGAGLANYQAAVAPYHQPGIFFNKDNDPDFRRKIVLFDERYKSKYWRPLEIYLYPHNIILNFWSELGLAGMLLFVWIIGKFFWLGINLLSSRGALATRQSHEQNDQRLLRSFQSLAMADRYMVIGLICAMTVIIVHGLVDVPYFKNDLAVQFWLLVAMMGMINTCHREADAAKVI